jgi:hypothetical protein
MSKWQGRFRVIANTYGGGDIDYTAQKNLDPIFREDSYRWEDIRTFQYLADAEKYLDREFRGLRLDYTVVSS